jgi:hypothetical protein
VIFQETGNAIGRGCDKLRPVCPLEQKEQQNPSRLASGSSTCRAYGIADRTDFDRL